jgi:hypothetical protein
MDERPIPPFPEIGPGAPVVDGATVRELVARQEAEIERLLSQLARVERTVAEIEAEVRAHPAYGMLDAIERRYLEGLAADEDERPVRSRFAGSRPGGPQRAPRTTVDARPRRAPGRQRPASGVTEQGNGPRSRADHPSSPNGSRFGSLVTSHWVWKLGIALTAIAVLLIKFG